VQDTLFTVIPSTLAHVSTGAVDEHALSVQYSPTTHSAAPQVQTASAAVLPPVQLAGSVAVAEHKILRSRAEFSVGTLSGTTGAGYIIHSHTIDAGARFDWSG